MNMGKEGSKHVFWQALILASVIFAAGLVLGFLFESSRADKLGDFYLSAETDIFDVQLESDILEMFEFDCERALKESVAFADRIFWEARELEKFDSSTEISQRVFNLHKRYDLLRVMLWKNLIELRKKCPKETNVIIYLYQYNEPDIKTRALQGALSGVLIELKGKYGDEIILVPIAYDTGVRSLGLLLENYDVKEFPAILVNEEHKVSELVSLEELEEYLVK